MSYADHPSWPDFYLGKRLISKPWREYFNKLYFNMAGREVEMAAVKCALTTINPRKLDLPKEDIDAMLGGNAAKLLGIEEGG